MDEAAEKLKEAAKKITLLQIKLKPERMTQQEKNVFITVIFISKIQPSRYFGILIIL
jgi:hypothetical protein